MFDLFYFSRCEAGYQVKYAGNTQNDVVCEENPERETTPNIPPHDISHPQDKNETHPVEGQDKNA
jgi:hypothetical protein